jgi:hypothetical protein
MNLLMLKRRLDVLSAKLPRPPGKPAVLICARRFDPKNPPVEDPDFWEDDPENPGKRRHPIPWDGTETETLWKYNTAAELEALRAKFDRNYGPATRAREDGLALFIEFFDTAAHTPPRQEVAS